MALKDYLSKALVGLAVQLKGSIGNKGKVGVLIDKIKERKSIWRKEINHWQMGRMAFHNSEIPTTHSLQEVYEDVMLDDQLTTVTADRKLRVLSQELVIKNSNDEIDEEKTKILTELPWLFDLGNHALDSIFFGYSLIFLKTGMKEGKNTIIGIELVPRSHVSPHSRLLLKESHDSKKGIPFDDYKNDLLYIEMYDKEGLLTKATPLTVLKRHSWGSWDEFEQIFGIPIRIGKYAHGNDTVKEEIAGWLQEMGSSSTGVFPKEAEIEIIENSKADAFNVFFKKIERVDAGIAKLILHQTGTTDEKSFVGSAEVHENTLSNVIKADTLKYLNFLNEQLLPALIYHEIGFSKEDKIDIRKTINPSKQIEIDSKLMAGGVRPTKEYIERTYGVEVEAIDEKKKAIE